MGQEVFERRLPSGLSVVLLKKPGFTQKFASFATHYGGMDSAFIVPGASKVTQVPDGIAHFLEHKLFEEPNGTDVSQLFSQMGMTTNAYTGSYYTVYYFNTVDRFAEGLDLLLDFVQTPYFTEASVAKEQGIIGQEIQSGLDSPSRIVYYNFLESMYHSHPAKIRTIGSVDSISRINPELLVLCHDTFYHPGNMMVVAAGDLDFDELVGVVENDMAGRHYEPRGPIERVVTEEPPAVVQPEIRAQLKISRPRILMGFKGELIKRSQESQRDYQRRLVAADLALTAVLGRVTPFYWSLYEKAVITEGFRFGYSAYQGAGYIWIDGETENASAFVDGLTEALMTARCQGLNAKYFEAARRQEIGQFLSSVDDPEQLSGAMITYRFNDLDFLDNRELLDEVTIEEGQAFLEQLIRSDNRVVSIVEPLQGGR